MPLDEVPYHKHNNYVGIVALHIILLYNAFIKKELKVCVQYFSFYHQIKALEVGLSLFKKVCVICFIESLLKMMTNAFYFILKALIALRMFKFLLMLKIMVMWEKRLDELQNS